jgi:hypothetical protein
MVLRIEIREVSYAEKEGSLFTRNVQKLDHAKPELKTIV